MGELPEKWTRIITLWHLSVNSEKQVELANAFYEIIFKLL